MKEVAVPLSRVADGATIAAEQKSVQFPRLKNRTLPLLLLQLGRCQGL